ncbi:hypothetical protein I8751_01995 [Nostocaceae cyanobacterium CENA357]|uniref:Uncharacterized protein n=1 Tax=Atlanticothrix silvestris CENA357 TaxID=1725252 RepID=A0A8J7H683_9CYAN|nr:hypothetical protein [Atlanticothrix silvestris]MBH8551172.1 hypothetical protein [Atlanticothrix silvestris CENA357]
MPNEIQTQARCLLDNLVKSVQGLVDDITALEVNTMVVEQISGAKFNAWQAYQTIYSINDPEYFDERGIPGDSPQDQNLRDRYRSLFAQVEREYFYLLIDPNSKLYKLPNEKVERYQQRLAILKKQKHGEIVETDPKYVKLARPILPPPTPVIEGENQVDWHKDWEENCLEIQEILSNDKFVRTLRKVAELKAALDSGDATKSTIDIIYAQTVMQLDGDIISRYHKELFQLPDYEKDLILKIHTEGVVAGEKQWRGMLDFLITLVQGIANSSLSRNGR